MDPKVVSVVNTKVVSTKVAQAVADRDKDSEEKAANNFYSKPATITPIMRIK